MERGRQFAEGTSPSQSSQMNSSGAPGISRNHLFTVDRESVDVIDRFRHSSRIQLLYVGFPNVSLAHLADEADSFKDRRQIGSNVNCESEADVVNPGGSKLDFIEDAREEEEEPRCEAGHCLVEGDLRK